MKTPNPDKNTMAYQQISRYMRYNWYWLKFYFNSVDNWFCKLMKLVSKEVAVESPPSKTQMLLSHKTVLLYQLCRDTSISVLSMNILPCNQIWNWKFLGSKIDHIVPPPWFELNFQNLFMFNELLSIAHPLSSTCKRYKLGLSPKVPITIRQKSISILPPPPPMLLLPLPHPRITTQCTLFSPP